MKGYSRYILILAGAVIIGGGLIWATGGSGYFTDNALAKIVKPQKPSVKVKLVSASITPVGSANEVGTGQARFEFTIGAKGGDILLPTSDAFNVVLYKKNRSSSTLIEEYEVRYGFDYGEGYVTPENYYLIKRDKTVTVILNTAFVVHGDYGYWNVQVKDMRWSDGSDKEYKEYKKKLNFKTPKVLLP